MANVEQIMDELRAGLKAGNVHAVKRATDQIIRMGLDPDLQLRAEQPLIERTLQILMRRGKEYQDGVHGPSQHFRTVAHIIDTLTPKDWPGIAKILDDNKHEIVRDLLLRMREGWTASAMIAAKDLQRWGLRWPELATIIHTAKTDVDSSVDESRDDHTLGTESLHRYLRQDLDRGDYDAAMEIIGELAWPTHASMDLSALLNPHKTGLMRAMLTTMSNNDSEGVLYIMPQYLGGFAKFGVHWPEFETIERSVAAMSRQERESDVMEEAFDPYAKQDAESAARQVSTALHKQASWDPEQRAVRFMHWVSLIHFVPRGYVELLEPILSHHKQMIIGDLLRSMKLNQDNLWMVVDAIEALNYARAMWPELGIIQKSIAAERQKLSLAEANPAYEKQDAERNVRGISVNLERMKKAELGWDSYHRLLDALYGVLGLKTLYMDMADKVLAHYKHDIMRTLLWSIKASLETGRDSYMLPTMLDALDRARVNWPELAAIKRSLRATAEAGASIDESNVTEITPYILQWITSEMLMSPWKAAATMIKLGLSYDSSPEIRELWDDNKDRTIRHMLMLIKGVHDHRGVPLMIKDFKATGLPWPELDAVANAVASSQSAGLDEAVSKSMHESVTVGDQTTEELVSDLEQDLDHADHEAALHTLDDLYFHDGGDLAVLLDAYKQGIMRELLKFIKDARTDDPVDRAMATRITKSLHKNGARWPELDVIMQSLKAIDDIHEAWSKKYKQSINCSHPRGFSQKAHCAARRKRRAGGKTKSKSVSEAIRGQHRFIQHVADQLQHDLERGDWTAANYTVQRLNQTDPKEVQEKFAPLAPLFVRMIDDDPMGTLNYMNRIMNYADHAYPEVMQAYDAHKTKIMQDLLKMVRSGDHGDWVRTQIAQLRNCGVDWKELDVITRSLLESTDPEEHARLKSEGRKMVLDILHHDLKDHGTRGIYYVMYHMDDWGFNIRDWPEVAEIIEDHKREIVTELLKTVKGDFDNGQHDNIDSVRFTIARLRKIGVDWPELAVIEMSIDADQPKQLDELKGYRADPVYAASQKEFAPSNMKTASKRDMAMERLTDYLETQGFKHIGQGSFSEIYLKQGYPWMFKLCSHDPAYLWWITWAAKHQNNPNVPRVKGLPVRIAPDTYVVRLEKLRGLIRREDNLSRGYDKLSYLVDRIESVDDLSKEDLQWIRSEYPGVYDILRVIQRAGSDFVVDLHGDNIMLRGQVPVITDPVVDNNVG